MKTHFVYTRIKLVVFMIQLRVQTHLIKSFQMKCLKKFQQSALNDSNS